MKNLRAAVNEFLSYCSKGKRLARRTVEAYGYDLKSFLHYTEQKSGKKADLIYIEEVSRDLIKAYIYEQNDICKTKTVKRRIACLRSFYSYLEEEESIEENPFDKLKIRIKEAVTLPECLELNEVKQILIAAYDYRNHISLSISEELTEFLHARDIAILEILFATGLRVHELCSLTFQNFDLNQQAIRVVGKGQKERLLYIGSGDVMKAVRRYLACAENLRFKSEYIFLNRWGAPLSCQSVRYMVNKYANLAGIQRKVTPHTFRHTFASLLLEEGVDIKYIQEFLGHSSISTTQIYLHTSEKKKREIFAGMHPRRKLDLRSVTD